MSNRREFLSQFLGLLAMPKQVVSGDGIHKFIITTPQDMQINQPIIMYGTDTLDAVVRLGMTVWTEYEWENTEKALNKANLPEIFRVKPPKDLQELRNEQYKALEQLRSSK